MNVQDGLESSNVWKRSGLVASRKDIEVFTALLAAVLLKGTVLAVLRVESDQRSVWLYSEHSIPKRLISLPFDANVLDAIPSTSMVISPNRKRLAVMDLSDVGGNERIKMTIVRLSDGHKSMIDAVNSSGIEVAAGFDEENIATIIFRDRVGRWTSQSEARPGKVHPLAEPQWVTPPYWSFLLGYSYSDKLDGLLSFDRLLNARVKADSKFVLFEWLDRRNTSIKIKRGNARFAVPNRYPLGYVVSPVEGNVINSMSAVVEAMEVFELDTLHNTRVKVANGAYCLVVQGGGPVAAKK